MTRYWWIASRRDGQGGVSLTPDEAAEYMENKSHKDSFMVERIPLFMDTTLYGDCEQSEVQFIEGVGFLEAGESRKPTIDTNKVLWCVTHRGVVARWVKRRIPYRIWDTRYAKLPGHYILHRDEDNETEVWITQMRPVYESERRVLPNGLSLLLEWEKDLLPMRLRPQQSDCNKGCRIVAGIRK